MPKYSDEVIQQVASANDIVDVIGSYFPLRRAGATYKALCPFHQEKSPSFTVNPARQIFKCFGCGAGGSVIRFVMDYEHLDFSSALQKLAERGGIRLQVEELSHEDRQRADLRQRLLSLHAGAAAFFHKTLLRSAEAQGARDYLKSRGLGIDTAKAWQIGYAPSGWDHLLQWAFKQGFRKDELLASGLITQRDPQDPHSGIYDRFRDRVMFPICNDTGEVIAFSGRVLQADAKAAKYVNSPETLLFTKGAVLFGLHRSKRALIEKNSAIVCEGQLDLITAFEAGITNVIAPQGTAFTPKQARILKRYVEEVVLCFDSDAAGEKAVERSLAALLAETLSVRVVQMPRGEDPDSVIRSQGAEAFRRYVDQAQDFFAHQLGKLSPSTEELTPRAQADAARKMADFLGLIGDPLLRETHLQATATRLGIDPKALLSLVQESARRPRTEAAPQDEAEPPVSGETHQAHNAPSKLPELDQTLRLLALVVLHAKEAREWILEEDWRAKFESEPGAELLTEILEALPALESPEGISTFLAKFPRSSEQLVCSLLEERPPLHPLQVLQDCWGELERRRLRRAIHWLKAKQRDPEIDLSQAAKLHQQILDLQKQLSDISRPFFSPL